MRGYKKQRSLKQILLTPSREHIVGGVFIVIALYIFSTTFRYSMIDYSYYQDLADRQQLQNTEDSVNRGTIYTTQSQHIFSQSASQSQIVGQESSILATSANLKNIAIDPGQVGDKTALISFLTEIIYQHICLDKTAITCYKNLQVFLKNYEDIEDFQQGKEYISEKISDRLYVLVGEEYITARLIAADISDEKKNRIESLRDPGLFFYDNNLYVNPEQVSRSTNIITSISSTLDISKEEVEILFEQKKRRYIPIIRRVSTDIREYMEERLQEQRNNYISGLMSIEDTYYKMLILEDNPTRFYPEGPLASQIVGFLDNDQNGRYGIEQFFDKRLAGQAGEIQGRKDALGRPIGGFDQENIEKIQGIDLYLTIDRNIQKEVEYIMQRNVERYDANSGSAIVMDPNTGKVLAMTSYPNFNPNLKGNVYELERFKPGEYIDPVNFLLGKSLFVLDAKGDKKLTFAGETKTFFEYTDQEDFEKIVPDPTKNKFIYSNGIGPAAYTNQITGALYEPGSVFKALTVAIGIDSGEIEPDTLYNDVNVLQIDSFEINNLDEEKCGGLHTFRNALNFSCNVGMVRIVQKVGSALLHKYLTDFGLGDETGVEIASETTGRLDPYEKWSKAQLFTTSFGQGIQVTQMQMAAAYSVLANGGIYYRPYIIDSKVYPNGESITTQPIPLRRVIKESTSDKIIAMLTEGTQIGFAQNGAVDGYDIAGKTGTSQIAYRGVYERGGNGHTITSFGGFGPSQNPQFVIITRFERPRTSQYAATTAAPVFSEIADFLLQYYSVPKNIGE